MRDYLRGWSTASPERVWQTLGMFGGALREVQTGQSRWLTKKFAQACDRVFRNLDALPFDPPLRYASELPALNDRTWQLNTDCPVCSLPAGPRSPDRYFTAWPGACKVQTGNLLYEAGLILWAVLLGLPAWAPGNMLGGLNELRLSLRKTGKAMSLFECPQCGRLTTCLYGYPDAEKNGFCRWCLDMGGGLGLGFSVEIDSTGQPVINMLQTDHAAPGRNSWDILPPEVGRRLASPK
ncbi:MAG: hypothetical protein PCFJNLEI_01171 [Verrucomicrobiae bacterium]|nr:hypothetical protein [Verrucomicrobiae bacterium]